VGLYVRVERLVEAWLYRCMECRISYAVPVNQGPEGGRLMAATTELEARKAKYIQRVAHIKQKIAALSAKGAADKVAKLQAKEATVLDLIASVDAEMTK
jgi:hypothetical protein